MISAQICYLDNPECKSANSYIAKNCGLGTCPFTLKGMVKTGILHIQRLFSLQKYCRPIRLQNHMIIDRSVQ